MIVCLSFVVCICVACFVLFGVVIGLPVCCDVCFLLVRLLRWMCCVCFMFFFCELCVFVKVFLWFGGCFLVCIYVLCDCWFNDCVGVGCCVLLVCLRCVVWCWCRVTYVLWCLFYVTVAAAVCLLLGGVFFVGVCMCCVFGYGCLRVCLLLCVVVLLVLCCWFVACVL